MASAGFFNTNDYEGRYLTFTWSVERQDIETNTTTIAWSLKGAGVAESSYYPAGNFKVIINGITVYLSATRINLYNGTVVANGTLNIEHESDGSKTFTASAEGAIYYTSVNCRGNGSFELPTITRQAVLTSAPDFTDEENPRIIYSNSAGELVESLKALISIGGAEYIERDIPVDSTEYTFILSTAERNILRAASPSSNTLEVDFIVRTVINSATYDSSLTKTCTIVNDDPVIGAISYADTNNTTLAITGDSSKIIQGRSNVTFTIATITALKSSSLISVKVTVNGITTTSLISGETIANKTISFGVINSAESLAAEIEVKDSRGNISISSVNITMLEYTNPTAIIDLHRVDNYKADTSLKANAFYSSLDGHNSLTLQYQYKETTDEDYGALTALSDGVETIIALATDKQFDFRVVVSDLLGTTNYLLTVDKGTPILFIDRKRRSIGVNCFPNYDESIEVNGDDPFYYHEGDEIELTDYYTSGIALSTTSIAFTIKLDKIIGDNSVSFSSLALTIKSAGNTANYASFLSVGSITISKASDTSITVTATINGSTYPVTADTVVGVIVSGVIAFVDTPPIIWDYELSNVDFDGTSSTMVSTGINPFSTTNISRNWEIILNAETTQMAENKTDIGLFTRLSSTSTYNIELGIRPSQTYIDRYRNIGGSETTSNVGSSGKQVKIEKNGDTVYIYVEGSEVWRGGVSSGGSDSQELTIGGVKMGSWYYFLGHLNYFKFRYTS